MNTQPNTSEALSLSNEELIQEAVNNDEGVIASNGAFSTSTGERTGRSPNDRFIVKEAGTKNLIDWGEINKPFEEEKFDALWNKGLIMDETIVIHGTAMDSSQFSQMASVNSELVWSPLSNLLLYGDTTDVVAAHQAGVSISISPD